MLNSKLITMSILSYFYTVLRSYPNPNVHLINLFHFSAKLEKEKKQLAKESGFARSEVAPQEVLTIT